MLIGSNASANFLGVNIGAGFNYYGGPTQQTQNNVAPTSGLWYHVAATTGPVNKNKIYVNGVLKSTSSAAGHPAFSSSATALGIGLNNGGNSYWKGSIDDVRMYERELNAAEVYALYASGLLSPAESEMDMLPLVGASEMGYYGMASRLWSNVVRKCGQRLTYPAWFSHIARGIKNRLSQRRDLRRQGRQLVFAAYLRSKERYQSFRFCS